MNFQDVRVSGEPISTQPKEMPYDFTAFLIEKAYELILPPASPYARSGMVCWSEHPDAEDKE